MPETTFIPLKGGLFLHGDDRSVVCSPRHSSRLALQHAGPYWPIARARHSGFSDTANSKMISAGHIGAGDTSIACQAPFILLLTVPRSGVTRFQTSKPYIGDRSQVPPALGGLFDTRLIVVINGGTLDARSVNHCRSLWGVSDPNRDCPALCACKHTGACIISHCAVTARRRTEPDARGGKILCGDFFRGAAVGPGVQPIPTVQRTDQSRRPDAAMRPADPSATARSS